jgi:diguanylate cyclase (GGDEF)-like protein
VNDQYGHPAGDEVLKRFAAILKKNTRASDICGRMGGDEFVIVATHVTQPNIFTFAERLRKEFIAERFDFNHESVDLSVSIGIAGFEAPELVDFEQLLARADAALYAAKTAGAIRLHETDRVHSD